MNWCCLLSSVPFCLPPAIIFSFMAGCVVTVLPYPIPCASRAVGPAQGQSYLSLISLLRLIKCHKASFNFVRGTFILIKGRAGHAKGSRTSIIPITLDFVPSVPSLIILVNLFSLLLNLLHGKCNRLDKRLWKDNSSAAVSSFENC